MPPASGCGRAIPGLCDAPGVLGRELDADRRTGQLDLPAGTRCMYGSSALTASSVAALAKVTRDRELALTALVVRAIERERVRVSPDGGARRRGPHRGRAVRRKCGCISLGTGRDRCEPLRRARDHRRRAQGSRGLRRLAVSSPSAGDIARFRATYAPVLARRLVASPAPSWLPEGSGLALATSAPESVFRIATGQRVTVRTAEGVFTVKAVDERRRSAHIRTRSPDRQSSMHCGASVAPMLRGVDHPHAEGCRESPGLRARPVAGARRGHAVDLCAVSLVARSRSRALGFRDDRSRAAASGDPARKATASRRRGDPCPRASRG